LQTFDPNTTPMVLCNSRKTAVGLSSDGLL